MKEKAKRKIYLCGPIDSRCCAEETWEQKKERFAAAECYLRHMGYDVINPLTYGEERLKKGATIEEIMQEEIREYILNPEVEWVYLMENWHYSAGCLNEHRMAARRHIEFESLNLPQMKFYNQEYDDMMLGQVFLDRERQGGI